jgi:Fe-S-cluster-containing dehydrogenase component
VKKGQPTACVEVCPTRSLTFGDLNDPDSAVSRLVHTRKVKVLQPETGNEPNVFFLS